MSKRKDCPGCKGLVQMENNRFLYHRNMPGVGPICRYSGEPMGHIIQEKK